MVETVSNAQSRLGVARAEFEKAAATAANANREKTSALNNLNAAQKAFDEAVAEARKDAPIDSDWLRNGMRERAV